MRVLVRADASPEMGTGHVMRCLALGQALAGRGVRVTFACATLPGPLEARLREEGFEVARLAGSGVGEVVDLARRIGADRLVLDGYGFTTADMAMLGAARPLLVIDDGAALDRYPADVLLNQNAYAHAGLYAGRAPGSRLLLGPRFALLRREFGPLAAAERVIAERGHRVLVTMGGSDPAGAAAVAAEALQRLAGERPDLEAVVVRGPGQVGASSQLGGALRVERDVRDMAALMAWADVAVAASGTTSWELAAARLPALVVTQAPNQEPVAASLEAAGTARRLGPADGLQAPAVAAAIAALLDDAGARRRMANAGGQLVDGRGAWRVAAALLGATVRLRQATAGDARLLWEWVNDPATRRASFRSDPVAWEEHLAWLTARLGDPLTRLYLAEDEGVPVGQVRFDRADASAMISVSVAPGARGRGLAATIIDAGSRAATAAWPDLGRIEAYIKPDNAASLAAFLDAGYAEREDVTYRGTPAARLTRRPGGSAAGEQAE